MNFGEMHPFLGPAILVCGFGVLLNACMLKKRGVSAAMLAGAFLSLGVGLTLAYLEAPGAAVYPFVAIMVALLVGDFLLRLRKLGEQR